MATLTIKGQARGAFQAMEKLESLISKAEASTVRLANIAKSLQGHYRTAAGEAERANRTLESSARWTLQIAGRTKEIANNQRSATAEIQKSNRAAASLAKSMQRAATASGRIRGGRGLSGGRGATPPPLPGGGGGGGILPDPAKVAGGFASAMKGAFSTVTKIGTGFVKQFTGAFGGALVKGGKAGFLAIASLGLGLVKGIAKGLLTALTTVFKTVANTALNVLKGAFVAAATFLGNSIRLAIKNEPIAEGFAALTNVKGLGDQVQVLNDLREAARGTVSDFRLMSDANQALQLGAAASTEELQLMIEAGRRLGKVTGRTAAEGFNDLATGIGRQSKLILDNLGLIVPLEQAYKDYADSVGTTADKLGDNEKKLAFQRAAFEAIRSKMAELGDEQLTVGDRLGQLTASFSNLSVQVGQAFLPLVGDLVTKWSEFISGLKAEDVVQAFETVGQGIKDVFTSIVDFTIGTKGELREGVNAFGRDLFNAITNPSELGFKILVIRFEQVYDLLKNRFEELWDDFVALANQAMVEIIGGPIFKGLNAAFDIVPDASEINATRGRNAESNRAAINRTAENEIRFLREEMAELAAVEKEALAFEKQKETARAGSGAPGGGGNRSLEAAAAAEAEARREAAEAAAAEKKAKEEAAKAEKARQKALRESERALNASVRAIEREINTRDRADKELEASIANLSAALAGGEVAGDFNDLVNDMAEGLRSFVDVLQDAADDVADAEDAMEQAFDDMAEEIGKATTEFSQDLRKKAQGFLLGGGEVPGETTRVRSLRRKAQREQRRRNKEIFQDTLGSTGFSQIQQGPFAEGGFSGFGAQNIERSGGILDTGVPGLEAALANLINSDGSTMIADLQAEIATIVEEGSAELEELNAKKEEALEAQREAQEAQHEFFEASLKLEEEAVALLKEQVQETNQLKAKQKDIERQLDQVRREARKNV